MGDYLGWIILGAIVLIALYGVTTYNVAIQQIPANIVAGIGGFKQAPLLEFEDSEKIQEAPKVSF